MARRHKPHQTKRAPGGKKKRSTRGCVCQDAGGFAEHLPMHVWRELMARQHGCPVHGDGTWRAKKETG